MRWFCALILMASLANAEGEASGDFDYYILSLSWSPNWCALEGDARNATQCDPTRDFGWVVHGLWPQYDSGWPSYCKTSARDPSRAETSALADIMGTSGAAWYQWKKHGRCAGLSSEDYFALTRLAYSKIIRPDVFRKLKRAVRLPASVVEQAFLEANPDLSANMIAVTCKSNRIQEARICLTKDLTPKNCGSDAVRECTLSNALFDPVR